MFIEAHDEYNKFLLIYHIHSIPLYLHIILYLLSLRRLPTRCTYAFGLEMGDTRV